MVVGWGPVTRSPGNIDIVTPRNVTPLARVLGIVITTHAPLHNYAHCNGPKLSPWQHEPTIVDRLETKFVQAYKQFCSGKKWGGAMKLIKMSSKHWRFCGKIIWFLVIMIMNMCNKHKRQWAPAYTLPLSGLRAWQACVQISAVWWCRAASWRLVTTLQSNTSSARTMFARVPVTEMQPFTIIPSSCVCCYQHFLLHLHHF